MSSLCTGNLSSSAFSFAHKTLKESGVHIRRTPRPRASSHPTMSIRDRLRPSASLTAPSITTQDSSTSEKRPSRPYTRMSLSRVSWIGENPRLTDSLYSMRMPRNPLTTGVILSCDDSAATGDVHREYVFIRGVHRTIAQSISSVGLRLQPPCRQASSSTPMA